MFTRVILSLITLAFTVPALCAQTPAPIVVQAIAPPGNNPAAAPAAIATDASESALKSLLQLKAANDEILRKQAATLLQLEEMEKAADQIKIYTKRG